MNWNQLSDKLKQTIKGLKLPSFEHRSVDDNASYIEEQNAPAAPNVPTQQGETPEPVAEPFGQKTGNGGGRKPAKEEEDCSEKATIPPSSQPETTAIPTEETDAYKPETYNPEAYAPDITEEADITQEPNEDTTTSKQDKKAKRQERKNKKNAALASRIIEIDFIRGIAVILMVFDHFMYDLGYLMPQLFLGFDRTNSVVMFARDYTYWGVRVVVRYIIVAVFLLLTGISCSFSKSNLRRGVRLMDVAFMLTLATYAVGIWMDNLDITITFGVLHCIALSLLFIGLHEKFGTNKWAYLIIGCIMVILGSFIYVRSLAASPTGSIYVSYSSDTFLNLFIKQIIGQVEVGGDSFAFFLYGGQIYVGVFLGKLLYPQRKSLLCHIPKCKNVKYHNNFLTLMGRNSLLFYFAGQIVSPLLIALVLWICGYPLIV